MTPPTRTCVGVPLQRAAPAGDDLPRLLARSARGDEAAFEQLYRAVAGPVYGTALRTLRDPAHAEEVAQEVLFEVWRTAAAYRPERGSVLTWVLTIAHHRAVDRARAARAATERDRSLARRDATEADPPDEQAVRSLDRLRVRSALAGLSGVQREAVVLAYFGGYSQREIAHRLEVPLGTVKTRIRDGLTRLRAAFALPDRGGARPGGVPAQPSPGTGRPGRPPAGSAPRSPEAGRGAAPAGVR
ncbi:sigma-70 family RNA polymerase sigma factor, partial [Kitasatospora sp. NPDC059973]|uniref:sigma-70 family RNA polymerase sigma factor n=1 Tax=Kitasatospora sp. NPDC059973 TaxID=3347020 RepID=UPI003683BF66